MRRLFLTLIILLFVFALGQKINLLPSMSFNQFFATSQSRPSPTNGEKQATLYEESVVTKIVEDALPSVVTIGISKAVPGDRFQFNPFDPFNPFQPLPSKRQNVEQNIGSGFIISADGLILTNKHVVADTAASYKVLTNDSKKYAVEKIYRDPLNDLAILKIAAFDLVPLKMGDSAHLKLGQMAIAIGTPLGEFKNTVTTGIISGLGRGITAGSPFEGSVEKLDNVIQTDAAISPGNSGGPLLNSKGEVIGINTAIASEGQNLGFAIPVNLAREIINNFNSQGGTFERPYIGVRYKMIDKQQAVLNEITEGAYVVEVVPDSPADKAGLQTEDIITEFAGQAVRGNDDQGLAKMILSKKIGEIITLKIWRNGTSFTKQLTLEAFK
ncbi:trypsin-like peptidase domain-containing protein [Candidatus Roizmanbacteria bacterium]|nr:trypsin-like peptidase domain-containing protein [Candidatus Roizmanbacteria bacterium]